MMITSEALAGIIEISVKGYLDELKTPSDGMEIEDTRLDLIIRNDPHVPGGIAVSAKRKRQPRWSRKCPYD